MQSQSQTRRHHLLLTSTAYISYASVFLLRTVTHVTWTSPSMQLVTLLHMTNTEPISPTSSAAQQIMTDSAVGLKNTGNTESLQLLRLLAIPTSNIFLSLLSRAAMEGVYTTAQVRQHHLLHQKHLHSHPGSAPLACPPKHYSRPHIRSSIQ